MKSSWFVVPLFGRVMVQVDADPRSTRTTRATQALIAKRVEHRITWLTVMVIDEFNHLSGSRAEADDFPLHVEKLSLVRPFDFVGLEALSFPIVTRLLRRTALNAYFFARSLGKVLSFWTAPDEDFFDASHGLPFGQIGTRDAIFLPVPGMGRKLGSHPYEVVVEGDAAVKDKIARWFENAEGLCEEGGPVDGFVPGLLGGTVKRWIGINEVHGFGGQRFHEGNGLALVEGHL